MVLLAVHDPALVQGLGTGLGLGKGQGPGLEQETGLGSGVGSEQGQEPGLDQPQPPPQSQSAHRIVISTTAASSVDIPPSHRPSPRPLAGALGTEAMAGCFTPLVVIAPPSVLAFLRDVALVRDSDYPPS